MAIKFLEIFSRTDAKSRIFVVLATIVGVGALIYFGSHYLTGGSGLGGQAKVANAPADLQSVPGGQLTPEYSRALAQENTQAAQRAQSTGGSSVATLVNVPSDQQAPASSNNCTVVCPGSEDASVLATNGINNLVKTGKLSQTDANTLLNMAKEKVSVAEYADQLDTLVKQGKVTPEQARKLLDDYSKQHASSLVEDSAQSMDSMIKSGRLPLAAANDLLALQKQNVSPSQYADELNALVRDGKITPQVAGQLLAQYTQQKAGEATKDSMAELQQMAKSGQITQDVADDLGRMQKRGASLNDYQTELNTLVSQGKITPATAAKLLARYRAERLAGINDPGSTMASLNARNKAQNAAAVNDLVKSGKISPETAATLIDMQKKNVSKAEYQAALDKLVKDGKLSAADAQRLSQNYSKGADLLEETQKLANLQANNATPAEFEAELTRAVKQGLISPQDAARLQQEYLARTAALPRIGADNLITPAGGSSPAPASGDFAKLQQRIQEQQANQQETAPSSFSGGPDNSQQFADAAANAASQAATAAEQARQQKIQELMGVMSGQAHQLLTAWAPPVMQHRGGSVDLTKKSGSGGASSGDNGSGINGLLGKNQKAAAANEAPVIKAGTIYFAVLDTAINSDFPDTPILATIIQGPYKGAKLLGKITIQSNTTTQSADRVSLQFTLMNDESWTKSQSITAFAIDPQTAHTVLASNVDYHYLKRYGSMLGSAFLSGYANAISNAGATTSTGIFGTTTTHPELSAGSKLAVGLGQVGTTLGTATANYINTPPTVKVNAGVGLGILFMSDLTLSVS